MLRRLLVVTLIAMSLLAGSFLLVETALPTVGPSVVADGGPPPPIPPDTVA